MADNNKSKLTYHVWDKDNNEYDIPDEVVQQRGMDNFAKDFEGGYITMFDDKKQKVDVPIEDVGEYRKQGYIWYDTSGNATPINEIGKKTSSTSEKKQTQYPQEVIDAYNSPDNKPGNFKDLSQLNDEYQRGELKKPSLISQALGMIPKVGAGNIGREEKIANVFSSMFGGGKQPQPSSQQQESQPIQQNAPTVEQAHPIAAKKVDGMTGAAPVQQVDAIYNKYVGKSDALSETMYDLMASGQAQNQEEAQQMAMGAMNRAAYNLAQRTTDEFVNKLGDTVADIEQAIDNGWYQHDVQDKLKNMASKLGIMNNVAVDENGNYITQTDGYDQFINGMVKPAMVESLVKKYGENYREQAEKLATRLYSHDEHVQDRLMNQDINDALSDVISKYTSISVAKAIQDAEAASNAQMAKYNEQSKYVDAASPFAIGAIAEANKTRDPQKILGDLQKKFGKLYQNPQFLNDMSNAAFKVMQRYGLNGTLSGDPKQFKPMINAAIKSELDQLEVKGMIPKGSADYILKTGIENTIIGKVSRKIMQTDYQNWLEDIANQQYQPGFWERVGSGALTFAGDAWSYWLPGAAGGKVTKSMLAKAEGKLASDLMAKGMEAKMAERAAKVLIGKSKGMVLKTGAAHGAVTFGGQSAISKPIDEVYRTGQFDENGNIYNPSVAKILANTLEEVTKQSAVGAIMQGGTIANMVGKGRGLATNILADVGGKAVDSNIMTGQQLLERMAQDPNFKPTGKDAAESFLESMANLTAIGLPGIMGKYARFKDAKEFNRKFDFNDQDIAELKRFGYNDLRDAFEKLGINGYSIEEFNGQQKNGEGNLPAEIGFSNDVQMMGQLTDKYMKLMSDKSVPEVLKAKMMAVVEGKRPSSFSPVIDSIIVQPMDNNGKVYLETLNKDGGIIDRKEYSSLEEAQKAEKKLDFEKSLNITSEYEKAYHTNALQDRLNTVYEQARDKYAAGEQLNDEEKAAIYLHQNAGDIGDIMQKQQKGMELTEQEQQMVNSYRHFYDSAFDNSPIMKEYVRTFEDSQGVEHGMLRKALEGNGKSRTAEQQKLVEEYQKQLYNDIVLKREMNDTKEQMSRNFIEEQRDLPSAVSSDVPPTEPPTSPVGGETPSNTDGPTSTQPQSTVGTSSVTNDASHTDADISSTESKSDAYVMGQNAYKNGDTEALQAINHNDDVAKARLKRAFANDEAQMNLVVKSYDDGKDMDLFIAQRANYMTPVQKEAVRKYVEAQEAKKGVYDALQHADDGYGEALKEQLWPYQTEDGSIVPATLTTGQQVFLKKSNEYGGGFVVVPDENGTPTIKQVSSADIKEVGTPISFDDFVNQEVTEQKDSRIQQFFAQFDGSSLKPNDTVEVAMEAGDEPMQMTFAGYSEDGKIVLSDGNDNIALTKDEFNTWRQNALDSSIGAELDAEDTQRANDDAAKAEAAKKERYKKGIFGYAAGQPDYSDPMTDYKVAAEYLQESVGNDRKALFGNIAAEKKSLQTRINQLREHIAKNEEWLSINADLDPKNAESRTLANKQMDGQIADLQARFDKWNKIRSAVMTPEEATAIKEDRAKKITDVGVNEADIVPIEGREITVLTDEELKKQYPTMDEASDYITSERKRIYKIQSDEVQREIDGVDDVLNRYVNGEIDLEPEQIKELNTTKAQMVARQANLTESAKELKTQADKLKTLYRKENMEERTKLMEDMTPAELRAVKVENAIKNGNLSQLNTIYEEVRGATDFTDIEPNTLEEYVASNIGRYSLNYEGNEKGGAFSNGIQQETGLDRKNFNKLQILAKEGEGKTVAEFVHSLYNDMPENLRQMGYNDQDIRNAFLDLIGSAESYSDLKNYTLNNKVADAERNMRVLEEQEAAMQETPSFTDRLKKAIAETEASPSEAQKKEGNYKKGHLSFGGYDFTIETPKGATRSGKDEQDKPWSVTMHDTYGYILGKIGVDGDHIDMFINDAADLDTFDGNVYVVDQVDPNTGEFDEHKVMYGYPSEEAATKAYLANYSKGWKGLGKVTGVPKATFDKWLETSNRKTKPFADYAMIKEDDNLPFEAQTNLDELPFDRSVKEVKPKDMTEAQQIAYKAVSTMLKKAGIPVKVVSNKDMERVAEEHDKLVSGGGISLMRTYHGSQASFDHFDHSFMGSGEGAQAYGWGTYVSEVEGIAKSYAKQNAAKHGMPREYKIAQTRLDHAKFEYDKVQRAYDNSKAYIDSLKEDLQNYRESIARRKEKVAYFAQNNMPETVDKLLKLIKRTEDTIKVTEDDINMRTNDLEGWKPKLEEVKKKYKEEQKKFDAIPKPQIERNLYSVDIPDDTGDNYLGWDEPLTEKQIEMWKNALLSATPKKDREEMEKWANDLIERRKNEGEPLTGQEAYYHIDGSNSSKKASMALAKAGFDGVKVIAQRNTGGNKENKMNYVIFDENKAKIIDHTKFAKGKGTVYGYTDGHEIVLNQEHLNPNTPIHEYQHIWRTAAKAKNPDLIAHGDKLIKETEWFKNLQNDPNYKHLNDEQLCDEAFARLTGDEGEAILEQMAKDAIKENPLDTAKELSIINRLKKWLKQFWYWTLETFTKWKPEDIKKMTLEDIRNLVLRDLAQGVDPRAVLKEHEGNEKEELKIANGKFNSRLDELVKNPNQKDKVLRLGRSSSFLKDGGIADAEIELEFDKFVRKSGDKYKNNHPFEASDLKNLPMAIAEPIAVFNSTNANDHVVLTELQKDGKNFIVAIRAVEQHRKGGVVLEVNQITSLYPKEEKGIVNWINTGRISNVDKEKALHFIEALQPHAGTTITDEELNTAANVINSFETSKENGEKFSLKDEKTMFGMHNISLDKLRKAIKQGGFAAPSMGVIDSKNGIYSDYGSITLIPKAEKLAKSKGKNAGTFTADAWTPVYPHVEKIMTKQGEKAFKADMNKLYDNVEVNIWSNIKDSWKAYFSNGDVRDGLYFQYLQERGMKPEVVYQKGKYDKSVFDKVKSIVGNFNKVDFSDSEVSDLIKLMNEVTGKDNSVEGQRKSLEAKKEDAEKKDNKLLIGLLNRRLASLDDMEDFYVAYDFMREVAKDHSRNGDVKVFDSIIAAKQKVVENKKMDSDFNTWLDEKSKQYDAQEMLYNGTTPTGKPKYIPNTIDNAVKLMKKQGLAGGYNVFHPGVGAFIAKLSPQVNTLSAMKKAKNKLIPFGDERHDEVRDKIIKEHRELARDLQIGESAFDDSGEDRMQELAELKPSDLKDYIKRHWDKEVSDDWVERYNDLVNTIKNDYPVYYFETKFMRPYGLDEFDKAIVPKDTPKDVVDALKKAGIDVHTYDGKEDREKVTMDAINNSEGIRFMFAGEKGAAEADKTEEQTIRMDNLDVAKQMEEAKKDAKAIKMATGWEKGVDGKWRYEMPDAKIKDTIDVGGGNIVKRFEEDMLWTDSKLEDAVDAPKLFEAYPQLKNIKIHTDAVMNGMPSNGEYDYNTRTITIHADELKYLNSILNHEIQHAIQHIEGFATGGNTEQIEREFNAAKAEQKARNYAFELEEKAKEMGGEYNQSEVEKALVKDYEDLGMSDDLPDKETRIKGFNYFARGYADRSMDDAIKRFRLNESTRSDFNSYLEYQKLAGEVEARNVQKRMGMSDEERRNSLASETEDVDRGDQIVMDGDGASYSIVKDPETIKKLDKEDTVKVYRAMQVGEDGKLYPPMAAKVKGKFVQPIELGKWEQADERPDLADDKGMFTLNKGNGKSLKAAYNPYLHTSRTPLNDQFSEAQNRPNIVTVEVEVPKSELTSGYKAYKAKDAVGEVEWKAGIIQGQLTGKRKVILSRWDKPVRIVPDSEVADVIVNNMFKDKNIIIPTNVVTPSLRKELEKRGVPFVETDNRGRIVGGENDGVHYSKVYGKNAQSPIMEEKLKNHPDSLIKTGTYFSGGGLVEEGLKGIIDPVVAVEYDKKISGVYRNNFGQHIVTADVRDVDPKDLVKQIDGDVEYFHASPVCKNYSQAKANGTEVELDKETAKSTADFINAVKPRVVTIENVKGYRDSEAMKIITNVLDKNGYKWDADVYNAADYGGYTNRERLIVRAVKNGKLPAKPKKQPHKGGWLEAVEDIIPTLSEKTNGVAPWMDARLKADGIDWENVKKPLYVMGSAYANGKIPHAYGDEILPTLRTKSGDVIIMPGGKVLRADGRVLARVSGMDDDYKLPAAESLAHTIIGNGIPTQLTKAVIAPLLNKDNLSGRNILARLGKSLYKNHWNEEEQRKVADNVVNTANQLGGASATVYTSLDEVPDAYLSDVKNGATGWYDPSTHTVHVYLPNCADADEAQRTVFHEKIGHEGMEVLLDGEQGVRKFANFVYQSVGKKMRGKILDFANKYDPDWQNPDRINVGTQEYIAHLAEEGPRTAEDFSIWTKIKHYLIKVLKKLGIRIPGLLNDKDLRYYLMKAGKALHVWDNMPKEKQEAMMAQASNVEIKDALSDEASKGKPRQKKGESAIQYMKRVMEWKRWKNAREDKDDPEPPMFYDFDKDAEGKKEWEKLNKDWRDAHGLKGDEMPQKPERKEGETDEDFFPRYKEWEKWKNAIVDKDNPMPDMFAFEKVKQDEARKKYEDWLARHELLEQQQADLDLYEGKIYPAETNPKAADLEQQVMQDLAEVTSTDVSKEGASTTVKHAVIHRRKNMEEASADDAIYINDVKNRIEKMAESGAFDKLLSDYQGKPNKAEKLAEAIPYIIEAPRRLRDLANDLNATGAFDKGHIHIQPADVEAIQPFVKDLKKVTSDKHTELKNGKEVEVYDDPLAVTEVASKMAQAINGNHQGEEGFVPIDSTDILNEHVLPIVKQLVVPFGIDYKNLSPEMKSTIDSIRDWYNYTYDWLKDNNTLKEDTGYNADYVNHIWDKEKSDPKAYATFVENRQRTKSPNEKPRTISTLIEGLEVGLVPKTTDITKMMAYYSRSNIEAWANKTMLQEVSGLNVIERNEDGEIISSDPLLSSVAPFNLEQYKYFEIPGVGPVWVYNVSPKQVTVKNPITGKEKVLYSEASAGDRFGVVFDTYQSSPFWKFFDTTASSMKKLELGFSGFHAGALTEVYMVQNMVEHGPKKALANFMKYIFGDTAKNHELPCFANPEDFQEAATHLVKFGATNDYAAADVQNMFDNFRDAMMKVQEKLNNGGMVAKAGATASLPLKVATQMLSLINKGMDRALWDFLHDGLKLATYRMRAEKTKARAKAKGWTDEQLSKALDEDGQFVNDMFGGQHWDVLGASHRTLRYAGRVLLSPDWNASTTRHFLALTGFGSVWNEATFENFKEYYKRLYHRDLTPEDEGRRSRQISALLCYGLGFMVFYEGIANGINAAFRALDEEKERKKAEETRKTNPNYRSPYELAYPDGMKWYDYLMKGNSLGQQSKIFMGRYEDGTEMYIRHGKQFREVPEYLFNHKGELEFPGPMVQRMIGKANPMVRMTLDDINYLSDFQASHADQEIQRKYGKTIGLLYKDALYWAPFLIPSQENKEFKAVDFFFPSSKGFSPWKAQSYFKDFILSGDMEGVAMTYRSCERNGIDPEAQIKAAIGSVKALESAEMKDGVTSLQIASKRFDEAKSITEKKKMRQKMKKFLSQSEYKAFTQKEALDMVQSYLNGEDDLKELQKADSKYLMKAKSEDVTEDWRIQNVWNGTMDAYQEYQRLKDVDIVKANAFKNSKTNKRLFAARKAISAAKKKMNKAKKQMDGQNDAAKMVEIRKTRKELLETLNGME